MSTSLAGNDIQFELELGVHALPYLVDHRVNGAIVLPAATYLEMVLVTAADAFDSVAYALTNITFHQALVLSETAPCALRIVISPTASDTASFLIASESLGAGQSPQAEIRHASGTIAHSPAAATTAGHVDQAHFRTRCSEAFAVAAHYEAMHASGLSYGPAFQAIRQIRRGTGEALTLLQLASELEPEIAIYQMHPALLDAGFQSVALARPHDRAPGREQTTFLPVGLRALRVYQRFGSQLWCHARITSGMEPDAPMFEADLTFFDATGQIVADVLGLRLEQLQRAAARSPQPQSRATAAAAPESVQSPPEQVVPEQHAVAAQRLARIWAEVLQFETVDIHESFLDLGGDSLMASQIAAKANRDGLEITPQQIFEYLTIARLIDVVTATQELYNA